MTGVAKSTILRLLEEVGTACAEYQDRVICNVKANRVQVDEIWSFVVSQGEEHEARTFREWQIRGRCVDVCRNRCR
jgi:hypothetical protein